MQLGAPTAAWTSTVGPVSLMIASMQTQRVFFAPGVQPPGSGSGRAPPSGPLLPAPSLPAGLPGSGFGASAGLMAGLLAALLALFCLAWPRLGRWLRPEPIFWPTPAFVSVLERPG